MQKTDSRSTAFTVCPQCRRPVTPQERSYATYWYCHRHGIVVISTVKVVKKTKGGRL